MDSRSKKDNFCDSKDTLIGVEEKWEDAVPSRRNVSSMPVWCLIVTMLLGIVFMFFVVAWQQTQIRTIQFELNDLLQNEINQLDHSYDVLNDEELKVNENEREEAIISRQRRQSPSNYRLRTFTPFAHLTEIKNLPRAGLPYQWTRPSSHYHSSSYYSNVRLSPSHGESDVQGIQVSCGGWFYVYAQVPYNLNSNEALGHKIVRRGNCGNNAAETVLQTVTQLPHDSSDRGDTKKQNWKYLGGVVHLAAGDKIEVQPIEFSTDTPWLNGDLSQVGGFFGLYEVQKELRNNHPICRSCS